MVYADILTYSFRVCWLPLSLGMFAIYFAPHPDYILAINAAIGAGFLSYAWVKMPILLNSLKTSILKLRMKADLVKMGATDEAGKPLALLTSESLVLRLTTSWYSDPAYQQLLFSADVQGLAEEMGQAEGDGVVEDEKEAEVGSFYHRRGMQKSRDDGVKAAGFSKSMSHSTSFYPAVPHPNAHHSSNYNANPESQRRGEARNFSLLIRGLKDTPASTSADTRAALLAFKRQQLSQMGVNLNLSTLSGDDGVMIDSRVGRRNGHLITIIQEEGGDSDDGDW
eukprot:gene37032-44940_t